MRRARPCSTPPRPWRAQRSAERERCGACGRRRCQNPRLMASLRDQIRMSDEELERFLGEQMVMQCATVGARGLPHLVPLWFIPGDSELRSWTYAKSQKAKNLE